MIETKTILSRDDRTFLESAESQADRVQRQRRMMAMALALLVMGLAGVLYVERDFWFSHDEQAQTPAVAGETPVAAATKKHAGASHKKKHSVSRSGGAIDTGDTAAVSATRTVLPPLQVEVVASNYRRTIHPGTNNVMVDLRDGSTEMRTTVAAPSSAVGSDSAETAASLTSNAAERAQVSSLTTDVVTHSVVPDYPTLARQMKVQGSVILQAMIGRDGLIQDLQVLSGPPILAGAAQEAVKQWHFKPHYQGSEAVETQTKITVNFTISTN
ncbi:MAG TPA: energy transducer TonB [Candidatus Binatia bacterium]|nr:energy transducer TonB [Candidatus Binatia bacterium]